MHRRSRQAVFVQRGKRARRKELVGQSGKLESGRLHAMAHQAARDGLAQAAHHRVVLRHHEQPRLEPHGS